MMQSFRKFLLFVTSLSLSTSMINTSSDTTWNYEQAKYQLLYKPVDGWVGDVMPMSDGDTLHLFYLHDARNGAPTFHPFYRMSTTDLVTYQDHREAIPTTTTFDYDCALGTGSVQKVGDIYHAFYTGHNYLFPAQGKPREVIRHAISTDGMRTFTKIEEDTFGAPEGYDRDNFRDPFLFYNENNNIYWLLITAIKDGNGVVARYSSSDLSHWELMDPLFTLNGNITECVDLFQMGDWWYLIYSSGWQTHYRMGKSAEGPWLTPVMDTFDSHVFYAAKTGMLNDERLLCGWIGTRDGYKDTGNWNWAGNLCVHQLAQQPDGTLFIRLPDSLNQAFTEVASIPHMNTLQGDAVQQGNSIDIAGDKDSGWVTLGVVPQRALISMDISLSQDTRAAGFTFGGENNSKAYAVELSAKFDQIRYDNSILSRTRYASESCYVSRALNIKYNHPIHLSILIEEDIAIFYVDDREALSVRIYRMPQSEWGLYAADGSAAFENITIRELK